MMSQAIMRPIDKIHGLLQGKGPDSKGYYRACCTAHEHEDPCLTYREADDGGVFLHCFKGCSRESILASLKVRERDLHSNNGYKPTARTNQARVTTMELAIHYRIHYRALFSYGVTDDYKYVTDDGKRYDGLRIAYKFRDGSEHTKIRLRYGVSGHDVMYVKETPGESIPYGLWKLNEAEQAGYLVIGEGESDAWTCWLHDVPFLGIPGATNEACLSRIDIPKEFANIPRIYVIQEPDQTKLAANLDKAAQGFYARVYRTLSKCGYAGEIYCVDYKRLTGYKDPNEMHQALTQDKTASLFRQLLEETLQKADPAGNKATQEREEQADDAQLDKLRAAIDDKDIDALWDHIVILANLDTKGEESWLRAIKAAFGKEVNLNKVRQEIANARKANAETERRDMDTVAELFEEQYGDTWAYDIYGQTWRKWTGTHWAEPASEEDSKTELDALIVKLLHTLEFEIKSNGMLDCVHRLARGRCKRKFVTVASAVNFSNGTWNASTGELGQHRKEDNFLYCLDYDFDDSGDYPQTRAFYESVLCNKNPKGTDWLSDQHAMQAVMAQFGLALLGDMKMHRILFLLGATRAGKSTIMRHGNGICGNVQAHATLLEERYGAFAGDSLFFSELEGKRVRFQRNKQRLVCADEIKPESIRDNEGVFKNMSAHSGVDMRGMNKDDQIDNTWRPKLIISSNEKPRYKDTSGAIAKRIIYLAAPRERAEQEQDLSLLDKLMAERGAFARDCIRVALAALEMGYIPKSRYMKEHAQEAEITGNALKAFMEECCVLGEGERVHTDKLYQAFLRYRERDGHSGQYAKLTMVAALKEMNKGIGACDNAVRIDGEQGRALYGIRLKTLLEMNSDEEQASHVQDDSLLLPELAQAQTLRCYTPVTINSTYRNGVEAACEAASQETRYDVTINSQNKVPIGTFLSDNNTKVGTLEGYYSDKISSHCNGNLAEQPVAPPRPRYDSQKPIVTACNIVTPVVEFSGKYEDF